MGTLVISKKENNTFKYTYNNRKGNIIISSNNYKTKAQCLSEINILKRNFSAIEYVQLKSPSGKLFFKLKINNYIVGTSRKFTTPLLLQKALNDFKNNFIMAEALDFTVDVFNSKTENVF